ncbi:UvrABC system protein C [Alloprevotella rava F0323]|uniref:UvrABC system protein C n=1 Tax=Alloprevotella rava F0323 TaxID=679199 RepID=G5GC22_9BACT|nr:excinuclease ABC subunit UvrC [Alloprevotella rava]EHG22918.1 UvrABC system protein C [Alloprevotella rava F0323]
MKKEERVKIDEYLKGIVQSLPDSPGCYQYLNEKGVIIYVGKAKNLKRRVSSYFNNPKQTYKTQFLVPKIRDIRYIVVDTEEDALLLENKLIKKYKPHYNVLLKDDKTYPSLAITNEYLPRLVRVRKRTGKGAQFFGPYSHTPTMYALWDLCKGLYKPRPCHTAMTREGIEAGKYEVCLEYHLHKCLAPCVGRQSRQDYINNIEACREILKGNTAEVARKMKEQMMALAAELRFEEAELVKRQYMMIENYRAKSQVISDVLYNIDVFNIESEEKLAYINYLHVVNGAIVQAFTFEYKKKLDETDEELLAMGIVEMRDRYESDSKEIIVPFHVDLPDDYALQTIPQRGDKKKLLDLSKLNVKQYRFDRLKQAEKLNPEQKSVRLMKEIQRDLGLEKLPYHIELFDNSNIQGEDAVAACVVFEKLKPCKKEYRKYNIKTVVGPDDYASMKEVVFRRYSRLREEGKKMPELIIADGGKGQMEVIREVVEDALGLNIPIAGLAKDDRHRTRELLFGFPPKSVGMKANSELFRLLTRMQDEVHRFAITFHRQKRSKRQTKSELDTIPGVGAKTKELLIKTFGSVKRIKEASLQQLQVVVGHAKGQKLFENLHSNKENHE